MDIVSDGELRRDNDIDYLLTRIPGVQHPAPGQDRLLRLLRRAGDRAAAGGPPAAASAWPPSSRSPGSRPSARSSSPSPGRSRCRAGSATPGTRIPRTWSGRWLAGSTREARELAAAGADLLQIDEPFLAGYPEQVGLAIEAVNIVTAGVPVTWALHVCYGNRYARPLWEGHYDFLFPVVASAHVDALVLEFGRKGLDDLRLLRQHAWDRYLGLGVVDVKAAEVEPADLVATRISPGAGVRPGTAAHGQPRLRAASPARRGGPREAPRDGRRGRPGAPGTRD